MREKFILIDGNSLANRAFYAIPMLSNSKGFITNAIYGFCNMLFRVMEDEKPGYIAVAFDKGKTVFRHKDYEEYKATRKGMPDELRPQFPVLKELLASLNIAVLEMDDYEADDIIGTLAKRGEKENLHNLIITGDRDALQLISPRTWVMLTKKGITEMEIYDEDALREKYGLAPWQMIELKGLMGDASDNIPGIPGVGEKTALKLLGEYGDVEKTLCNSEAFKGKKLGQLLVDYADQARLSRRLAVIDREVPLDISLAECRVKEPDYPRVCELLRELEFKNLLQSFSEKMKGSTQAALEEPHEQAKGRVIKDPCVLEEYLLKNREFMSFYLCCQKEASQSYTLTGLALKARGAQECGEGESVLLRWESETELAALLKTLKPFFENENLKKATYDVKTASLILDASGIALRGVSYDILLQSYLLDPSRVWTSLAEVAGEYLGVSISSDEPQFYYNLLSVLEPLARNLQEKMHQLGLWPLYRDVELPLSLILAGMEKRGVIVDGEILKRIGNELDARMEGLEQKIWDLAGEKFNINSPKQLGVILFGKLGLARGKKTKTGYSTSAEVLESLAQEHEIVARILEYRQVVKLKTTYIDGLQGIKDPKTSRVHTSFNQAVTATGRLSSTEPNLQNIPIRLEEGRRIRKAFIPSPGHLLLSADYSQIELRVLAHLAQDEVLIEAFRKNQDIHARTAAEVFGVPLELVSPEMRRAAKAVNFGIIYGISDYGLSQDLGIPRAEARAYIDSYFQRYRGVKLYIDNIIREAREKGYVTTILNRRRYLPDILSRNFHLRSFAERAAMNTPIQGSAADIIKLAMIRIAQEMRGSEEELGVMILQVHDELIFDVPLKGVERLARLVNKVMSTAYPLRVPLKVDIQTGSNWYDMAKYNHEV